MLTNPPVVISECKAPIKNTRQVYHEENNEKIKGRGGFIFGSFKSDKERIKDSLENNMLLLNETYTMGKNQKSRNKPQSLKKPFTESARSFNKQPALRFQPRTDLERIKEALDKYNRDYSSIVSRQLNQLDLNVFQQKHKNDDESEDDKMKNEESFIIHTQKSIDKNKDKFKKKKFIRAIKYKKPINIDAKKILAEYHYKTHFKGAESMAIAAAKSRNNSSGGNDSISHNNLMIPRLLDYDNNETNDENINKYYTSSSSVLPMLKKNYSGALIKSSYVKNQNPNRTRYDQQLNKEKFEQLKILMQECKTPSEDALARALEQEEIRNIREHEMILIGNEKYSMKNQLDIITHKMLNKCHIYKGKNKNNKIVHKAREGKMMMTNGMTVKDFENKYQLNMDCLKRDYQ